DVAQALPLADLLAVLAGFVKIPAMLYQLGAQGTHGGVLVGIVLGRHHQHAANAEKPRSVSQRLAVIARGAADDATVFLLVGQPRYQVDAAADLEGSCRRMVFVLEIIAAAQ